MSKVLVLELADDDADVQAAIREDAERVLRVFDRAHLEEAH